MQSPAARESDLPDVYVTIRRNDSLGSAGRWRIFGLLCALSFGLALAFAAFGAWLVLPYSALEMAVLFWGFHWFERRSTDWECISFIGDRVIVERVHEGVRTRHEFNRYWTRLEARPLGFGRPLQLALSYAGERVPFGDDLAAAERQRVAKDVRRALAAR